ncbi:hypothetical protein ACFU0X_10150 [Streptomyces cellulosae]|uniref:Uncharacterized protein n=1 Tax=Streptomyces cellulosae TaxID=1968 RepID=A0ABW6JDF9_STRCE
MGCATCGGGRQTSTSTYSAGGRGGAGQAWRLTDANGAEIFYVDGERAKRDHELMPGSTLDKINPITGALLTT